MTRDVTVAVLRLQESLMRGRLLPWRAEQTEEALNGLLANPKRTGDPFHLQRNALSDARKKLVRRAALLALHTRADGTAGDGGAPHATDASDGYDVLHREVVDTIQRKSSDADRRILAIAMEGGNAADVAEILGVPYDVAKVRLSRARLRARDAWCAA